MLTKHLIRINSVLALGNKPTGNLASTSNVSQHICHQEQFVHSNITLRGVPNVEYKLCCSLRCLNNEYLLGSKSLRNLSSHCNICDVSSFHPGCRWYFGFTDLHLLVAGRLISAFSNSETPSGMETDAPAVAPAVCLETLKIDSSPTADGNDPSVPENVRSSLEKGSGLVGLSVVDNVADLGDTVLHKGARDIGAGLEFPNKGTEEAEKTIELSGTLAEISNEEVSNSGGMEAKTSNSVPKCNRKNYGRRANLHGGGKTQAVSEPSCTANLNSEDGGSSKNAASSKPASRYVETLVQFKAKLASNQTVLPSELLLKVSQLAEGCHVEGHAKRLAEAFLDQPVDRVEQPEGEWHHGMEKIFRSYFNETAVSGGEISSSKRGKEKKSGREETSGRPRRIEPSHFVAIQITNFEIHEKLAAIQKSVVANKRILEEALVNLPTLHVTLMVLCLKDNEQIERAKTALEVSRVRVLEHGKDLAALPFVGIGDFNGKIVFAKVKEGPELERLRDIAATVQQSFAEQQLFSTDQKGFNAHLTIMKLSKCPWLFKKGIRRINPDFYADQKDDYFGSQPLQSLQLCAMKKADNGYYPVDHEVFFESEIEEK